MGGPVSSLGEEVGKDSTADGGQGDEQERWEVKALRQRPANSSVISLCGRTYQTETAMWGDMFYSATITLVPQVTLVLHGLLPLHPLYNIHVLLHNI